MQVLVREQAGGYVWEVRLRGRNEAGRDLVV